MHGEELQRTLDRVTEEILDVMRRDGFWYRGQWRRDPLVWDINNGWCDAWADRASDLIPGAFPVWVDTEHCVLVYNGRFYDADCLQGVTDYKELPMFNDPKHKRPAP